MKRAVKIISFLFLALLPGLFHERPANCAGAFPSWSILTTSNQKAAARVSA